MRSQVFLSSLHSLFFALVFGIDSLLILTLLSESFESVSWNWLNWWRFVFHRYGQLFTIVFQSWGLLVWLFCCFLLLWFRHQNCQFQGLLAWLIPDKQTHHGRLKTHSPTACPLKQIVFKHSYSQLVYQQLYCQSWPNPLTIWSAELIKCFVQPSNCLSPTMA